MTKNNDSSSEKIGTSKISYHSSDQINRDNKSQKSGEYENTGGKETWKVDGMRLEKDSYGVWRDKKTGDVYRGENDD